MRTAVEMRTAIEVRTACVELTVMAVGVQAVVAAQATV
jgi:hypothetical protein